MPIFPGHPNSEALVLPHPARPVAGDRPWGPINEAGLGCTSDLISATAHSGAHIDALAHMTVGEDDHWFGGGSADTDLGDFGPTHGDAESCLPFSLAASCSTSPVGGVDRLAKGEAVTAGRPSGSRGRAAD